MSAELSKARVEAEIKLPQDPVGPGRAVKREFSGLGRLGFASLVALTAGFWLVLMAWNAALWSDDRRIDEVASSVENARDLGVALSRPALFDRASTQLDAARAEAARQRANIWPRRFFLRAESHLDQARRDSAALLDAAHSARSDAESSAHQHLDRANRAVEKVVGLYERVPMSRDTRLDLAFMQRDVHRLAGDLNVAELAYSSGEPILAASWARHVEAEATKVATLIDLSMGHRFRN